VQNSTPQHLGLSDPAAADPPQEVAIDDLRGPMTALAAAITKSKAQQEAAPKLADVMREIAAENQFEKSKKMSALTIITSNGPLLTKTWRSPTDKPVPAGFPPLCRFAEREIDTLAGLAAILREIEKATFEKELQVGREIVEQIPPPPPIPQLAPPLPEEENKLYRLAIDSPDGAIVLAYIELEKTLRDIAIRLGMGAKVTNQRSVVEELMKRELVTKDGARLFDSLRRARNSAAHGVGEEKLTSQDALEYIRQVNLMVGLLTLAAARV
jgi:hypothetical protein